MSDATIRWQGRGLDSPLCAWPRCRQDHGTVLLKGATASNPRQDVALCDKHLGVVMDRMRAAGIAPEKISQTTDK